MSDDVQWETEQSPREEEDEESPARMPRYYE